MAKKEQTNKKHYTENLRSNITNPTKNWGLSQLLQFLFSTSDTLRVILVENEIQKRTSDFLLLQSVDTKMWIAK